VHLTSSFGLRAPVLGVAGSRVSGFGLRVADFGLRVSGFGPRVYGLGFQVSSSGDEWVKGKRGRVSGLGLGLRIRDCHPALLEFDRNLLLLMHYSQAKN